MEGSLAAGVRALVQAARVGHGEPVIVPRPSRTPARQAGALLAALALLSGCASAPPAPIRSPYDLVLRDVEGGRFDFTALHGQAAIVYFFATWCLPCLAELETLESLHQEAAPEGLQVVAVGMDLNGPKVLLPFARGAGLPFDVLLADDELREGRSPYGRIRSVPTTVVLDRQGRVAAAYEGPADPQGLRTLVRELLR